MSTEVEVIEDNVEIRFRSELEERCRNGWKISSTSCCISMTECGLRYFFLAVIIKEDV